MKMNFYKTPESRGIHFEHGPVKVRFGTFAWPWVNLGYRLKPVAEKDG